MKFTLSLNRNKDFRLLYSKGTSAVQPSFVIYVRKNRDGCSRLGVTVSKKIGNAVTRNRARRVLREAYRLLEEEILPGRDVVLVARSGTAKAGTVVVMRQLHSAYSKCGILRKEKASDNGDPVKAS